MPSAFQKGIGMCFSQLEKIGFLAQLSKQCTPFTG